MAEDPSGWSLTESDPQVFTQLLRDLGVKGLQVDAKDRLTRRQDDLYSLDAETLQALKPIHALIFLFKHVGYGEQTTAKGVEVDPHESGVWFANQVINNSCGTLAALNAVMNIAPEKSAHPEESIAMGSELENLKEFGAAMSAMDLGHAIASHDLIRETHNSFSKSSPFSMDPSAFPDREKEDPYHFVAYVPVSGMLYELDGLRQSPLMHAVVEDDWVDQAREVIEERIQAYPAGSLMFNLLCVRSVAVPRIQRLLKDSSTAEGEKYMLQEQLEHEQNRAQRGKLENALRRNNLLPAVFAMLKGMGESGLADKAVEEARAKGKVAREKAKEQKESAGS